MINQSNRTIEIEISQNEALIFEPHSTKTIDAKYRDKIVAPLVVGA